MWPTYLQTSYRSKQVKCRALICPSFDSGYMKEFVVMLCVCLLCIDVTSLSVCAEQFLSDGNIGVDISVTSSPIIKSNYIESYHKV